MSEAGDHSRAKVKPMRSPTNGWLVGLLPAISARAAAPFLLKDTSVLVLFLAPCTSALVLFFFFFFFLLLLFLGTRR
jgi:hypothetical protein